MPIDKFTLEEIVKEEEELLSYVEQVAKQYCPDIDFDSLNQTHVFDSADNAIYKFMQRYNTNTLGNLSFDKYIKSEQIQGTLKGMGVDVQKFWYLLLFIFDYTDNCSWNGLYLTKSPKQELQKLVEMLDIESAEQPHIIIKRGKKSFIIENEYTIACIAELCKLAIENTENGSIMDLHGVDKSKTVFESLAIGIFANMFLDFFELNKGKFNYRKSKDCDFPLSKKLLISRLVYLTHLSMNENYNDGDENLKDVLKKYKDKHIEAINNVYS